MLNTGIRKFIIANDHDNVPGEMWVVDTYTYITSNSRAIAVELREIVIYRTHTTKKKCIWRSLLYSVIPAILLHIHAVWYNRYVFNVFHIYEKYRKSQPITRTFFDVHFFLSSDCAYCRSLKIFNSYQEFQSLSPRIFFSLSVQMQWHILLNATKKRGERLQAAKTLHESLMDASLWLLVYFYFLICTRPFSVYT